MSTSSDEFMVGDIVKQTVTCGPTVKGRVYTVSRGGSGGGKLVIRPEDATEYCHCKHNWKLVSRATLETRYANK